ncbi:MAG: glycosyltransferase [Mycolicibacterium sp.]
MLSTYPPTVCGLARFTAGLSSALSVLGSEVGVVRVADGSPSESGRVVAELVNGSVCSVAACTDSLNDCDVAVIQHEYGIYGGVDGAEVLDIIDGLRVPVIVVAHTVPKTPTPHQLWVLGTIASKADRVVVMSETAGERLCGDYAVGRGKVVMIPHGATVPRVSGAKRGSRPTILTWGLLGPGKGLERVIDAMSALRDVPDRPRYLVVGQTHPKVFAATGEAYRESLIERARQNGVADSVSFDARYHGVAALTTLIQSAAVVALPYDSVEQVTSGVLVDAIAGGRPVVATAFPHAVEMLSGGAGIVVGHDDPAALVSALRRVLTQPRLAGTMAAEARRLAPQLAWPAVAGAYAQLGQVVLAERRARV